MKPLIVNPFITAGYVSPEYFCDRLTETSELINTLKNGTNVTLMSQRRLGKTGLIQNVFHQLRQEGFPCFYIDIYGTQCLEDFVALFAKSIIHGMDSKAETVLQNVVNVFKSCRPVVQVDPITGAPSFSVELQQASIERTLDEAFDYLAKSGKVCFVAFDEFQQIAEYPEKGLEATLRSKIQFLPNVHFIFSGSKMHLLSEMFSSPKRPFYQSTRKMPLDIINRDTYYAFAEKHFKEAEKSLPREMFDDIYDRFDGVTWYIQMLLNRIYQYQPENINMALLPIVLESVVEEESSSYKSMLEMMTINQSRLLRAIAMDGNAEAVTSSDFLRRHQLKGASSVSAALKWLMENDFVRSTGNSYQLYDKFMEIWLRRP